MIPMKLSSICRSRWMALLWAAGIVWLALDVAGPAPGEGDNAVATDATGAAIDPEQARHLAAILAQP